MWRSREAFPWTLWLSDTGGFAGLVEVRLRGMSAELGYALSRSHWGRGLMTEAVVRVVSWARGQPGVYRVWATCDVDNVASSRLLYRAGFVREGVLRGWLVHPNLGEAPRDAYCYGIVR